MLSLLDPVEWAELQAFHEDEPFGAEADDVRAAKLAVLQEPTVKLGEFLKTPGERRREIEGPAVDDGAAWDAYFESLMRAEG